MDSHVNTIGLEMSILLFVTLGGYLLASRIHQPSVVGQIMLGVLIGPSLLGWIAYSTFPVGCQQTKRCCTDGTLLTCSGSPNMPHVMRNYGTSTDVTLPQRRESCHPC